MESLYLLIPISVLLVLAIGIVFWRALRSGQMDDLEGPGYRILMDDDRATEKKERDETPGPGTGRDDI